jgi:hypothetical protein
VRKVPVDAVRNLLPSDTPYVTPQQRRQTVAARARAVNARLGF